MDTQEILNVILEDGKTLPLSPKGYVCRVGLFSCDLHQNKVPSLFEFQIDYTFSLVNPQISISIPIGTVEEIYEHEYKFNRNILKLFMTLINKKTNDNYDKKLSFVTFSILHEIGHWNYFCESDFSPKDYEISDGPFREKVIKMVGNEDELFWAYRNIPSEAAADKWALEHINNYLDQVKLRCNKS